MSRFFNIHYKIIPVFAIFKIIVAVLGGFIDVYHVISCKHAHLTNQKTQIMYFVSEFNAEAVCQSVAACMKPYVYMYTVTHGWVHIIIVLVIVWSINAHNAFQ